MKKTVLTAALLGMSLGAQGAVDYSIDLLTPDHHLGQVTITLPAGHRQQELMMPAWRTGKYKILDLANTVRHFKAVDSQGKALAWQHRDKASWQIDNPGGGQVTVTYQIYANQLGLRSRHIDDSHAYLDATGVFMYNPALRDEAVTVALAVPEHWRSYSGMTRLGDHKFSAADYDQLADSPIETGVSEFYSFRADGKDYELVIWGEGNYDGQQMAEDLKKLVPESQTIWQGYPYDKYVFMVHATTDARGATEHVNSTIIQRRRFDFAPREEYLEFLTTASHELVHTWNVKAYRPEGLAPYDYQRENYTDMLWISEGSTSYFQSRLLLTAGLIDTKEFLKRVAKRINDHRNKPGRKVQNVSESSRESWIAMSGDFASNHSVNIYSEGYLASLALDFEMLKDSGLKAGYKDLHRVLYSDFRLPGTFSAADLRKTLKQLTGEDYRQWWQQHVESPLDIDFDALMKRAGLRLVHPKDSKKVVDTGFSTTTKNGLVQLTRVRADGPAWQAGLTPGDQLLAINGLRVAPAQLKNRLKQYQPGEQVALTLFRRDRLVTLTMVMGEKQSKPPVLVPVEKPTRSQKAFFKAWAGVELPKPAKD